MDVLEHGSGGDCPRNLLYNTPPIHACVVIIGSVPCMNNHINGCSTLDTVAVTIEQGINGQNRKYVSGMLGNAAVVVRMHESGSEQAHGWWRGLTELNMEVSIWTGQDVSCSVATTHGSSSLWKLSIVAVPSLVT